VNFDFHSLLAKASKNNVFTMLEGAINAVDRSLCSRSAVDLKNHGPVSRPT
jgi:DNA-binding FadR family transcriptional regulator